MAQRSPARGQCGRISWRCARRTVRKAILIANDVRICDVETTSRAGRREWPRMCPRSGMPALRRAQRQGLLRFVPRRRHECRPQGRGCSSTFWTHRSPMIKCSLEVPLIAFLEGPSLRYLYRDCPQVERNPSQELDVGPHRLQWLVPTDNPR